MSSLRTETALVDVRMPAMGTSVVEGTVVEWKVAVGDSVAVDDPVCAISSDKVETECPAPASGTIVELLVPEGETVEVDTLLARIAPEGADVAALTADDGGAVSGSGSGSGEASEAAGSGDHSDSGGEANGASAAGSSGPVDGWNGDRRALLRRSSPVALRVAEQHGIDVRAVSGSGRGGRVTKQDVLAAVEQGVDGDSGVADEPTIHIESPYRHDPSVPVAGATSAADGEVGTIRRAAAPPRATATPASSSAEQVDTHRRGAAASPPAGPTPAALSADVAELGGHVEPLSVMRRAIAGAMRNALDTAAHATTIVECDMSRIEARRRELGMTALPLFTTAVLETLREYPALNATFDGEQLVRYDRIHLGVAVSLGEDGLIVPVIKDAQDLSAEGIGRRIKDLAVRARAKRLEPDEVRGGTFTITSPGQAGALIATPVINVPQVAILDLEAIVKRPVVVTDEHAGDSIAIRPMAHLCMSWDHRALDGMYAAQFLTALRRRLETAG